jgi:uncharacterized protein
MSIIPTTIHFVKAQLQAAEGGHDWFHIQRVYNNALNIAKEETCDLLVVQLAALLHDIADSKFHNGDETLGPNLAQSFLTSQNVSEDCIAHVVNIIKHMSFKGGNEASDFYSIEFAVVQDADRLDAIGAIGIARAFNYGGFKNRMLYDPEIAPVMGMNKVAYKNQTAPTINHFYEKLLLLKDRMHTQTAREMAEERHRFMELYLSRFYAEWEGVL